MAKIRYYGNMLLFKDLKYRKHSAISKQKKSGTRTIIIHKTEHQIVSQTVNYLIENDMIKKFIYRK